MATLLDPFLNSLPTPADLAAMSRKYLAALAAAARAVEAMSGAEIEATREWARAIREAAERALEAKP